MFQALNCTQSTALLFCQAFFAALARRCARAAKRHRRRTNTGREAAPLIIPEKCCTVGAPNFSPLEAVPLYLFHVVSEVNAIVLSKCSVAERRENNRAPNWCRFPGPSQSLGNDRQSPRHTPGRHCVPGTCPARARRRIVPDLCRR